MDCKKADNLLIDFLYGELSPDDQAAFERHLQGCPEHTREVEKLRGVLNLVRAQEPEEVPEAVSARIIQAARAQMPQKTKPSPFFSLIWNPAAAAAVLVVVVITVGLATHFMSGQAPEEDTAIEAARPLATAPIEMAEAPKTAAKAEEKAYKRSKSKKRRKPPAKKKAFKSMPAPIPKTPEVWGTKAKPKPSIADGARGGAGPTKEESRFAKPPPPAKAPPASPPREETMEAESAAGVAMDMEDDSYSQSPAPRAKKKQPTDYYQAAEGDLANKRYDAAVSKYRTFLSNNPTDPRAPTCHYRIAKALFLAGRCPEAVGAIDTAVSASPRHPMAPGALLDQGSCYERLSRLSEAETTYRRVLRNYPTYEEEAQKGIRRIRRESDVKPAATEQHR